MATKLNLIPTAGHLIIEQVESETKTASGIYLPEKSADKPQKGTVLAVGSDEVTDHGTTKKSPVKVGDIVIYKKWGGNEVKLDGHDYLFVKFDDILAIVK
jgi:chaperonin GroES